VVDHAAGLGGVVVSHNQRDRARFQAHVQAWRQRGNDTLCVLFLPRDPSDDRLLLRTLLLLAWYGERPQPKPETLIWNDAAQALIHGYQPPGFEIADVRHALGQAPPRPLGGSANPESG